MQSSCGIGESIRVRLARWLSGDGEKPAVDVGGEKPRPYSYGTDVQGEGG